MPETRPFGRSGLQISPITLGGNVFGWSADEDTSFAVLDAYVQAGGNVIDTANTYSAWVPGNAGGESEAIIGRWLEARGDDDGLVVATKVGMAGGDQPRGLTRDIIRRAAEESLTRLRLDRIDLYYAHEDDPDTPIEETLRAFDELVREGIVGTIAASNYSGERLAEALAISEREGLPRFEGLQARFNLLDRDAVEGGAGEVCRAGGLAIASYTSLARGFLTGKYRRDRPVPEGVRTPGVTHDYLDERGFAVLDAVDAVATAHSASPAQVALAWIVAQPGMTSALAGATSPDQVRELMGALDVRLAPDEVATLDSAGR